MTFSEAEAYSKTLRKAGFYATPMWHWGNSSYVVVIANKLMVVSTPSEMIRWMDMYRVERLINEREQAKQESRDIYERSRSASPGDDG